MSRWTPSFSDVLRTTAHQVEKGYDSVRVRVKQKLGRVAPPRLLPYRGYGNARELIVTGRVLESRPIREPQEADTWWTNAKGIYRRFATDEIAEVRVRASLDGWSDETTTDEEGYFRFHVQLEKPLDPNQRWHDVDVELLDQVHPAQGEVKATAQVLTPSKHSTFGVISDVDDTIIKSNATDFMKLLRLTVFKNIHTRSALPGVSHLYRALEAGRDGKGSNPFFYVSSSAWNLYDVIRDFIDLHDIPAGAILLRDLGIDEEKFIKSSHAHKFDKIEQIMETCSDLPFVLIGDAGQDDAMIYQEVVRRFPGRVRAIYIRTVGSSRRNDQAREIAKETDDAGTPMQLVDDVDHAMRHAEELRLVAPGA